ncbi:MAG: PQQ-binding-like beta-propeller repeat protein [Desulfobacterales bacterium]
MSTSLRHLVLLYMVGVLIGCTYSKPSRWGHFHGDLGSQGFQQINSGFALSSTWTSAPYKVTSSSPVIGYDFQSREVLYVGTTDGKLVAIRTEDGSEKWQRALGATDSVTRIFSSPSVSDSGDIYVITSRLIGDERMGSTLHKVDQFGKTKWAYVFPDNGFTSGSPKVVTLANEPLIFVYTAGDASGDIQGELLVLRDEDYRAKLLDHKPLGDCSYGDVAGGAGPEKVLDFYKNVWDFFGDFPVVLDISGVDLPDHFVDPSVAIIANRVKPLIAIADNLCNIGAFEWDGVELSVTWRERHKFNKHSSAVVLPNNLMVFGQRDEKVLAYDAETGVKMWEYDAGQPVLATPAAPSSEFIFVVSKNTIQALNPADGTLIMDGKLPRKLPLLGTTHSSPAVTANRIYVANSEMLTLTYDLKTRGHDTNFIGNRLSSVAIGSDGAVYAVAFDGTVHKYSGTD